MIGQRGCCLVCEFGAVSEDRVAMSYLFLVDNATVLGESVESVSLKAEPTWHDTTARTERARK